jgi:hypothetical protein
VYRFLNHYDFQLYSPNFAAANKELRGCAPEAHKVFLLAVAVGLRRKQIDLLETVLFSVEGKCAQNSTNPIFSSEERGFDCGSSR